MPEFVIFQRCNHLCQLFFLFFVSFFKITILKWNWYYINYIYFLKTETEKNTDKMQLANK